jgi:hypothetical protein
MDTLHYTGGHREFLLYISYAPLLYARLLFHKGNKFGPSFFPDSIPFLRLLFVIGKLQFRDCPMEPAISMFVAEAMYRVTLRTPLSLLPTDFTKVRETVFSYKTILSATSRADGVRIYSPGCHLTTKFTGKGVTHSIYRPQNTPEFPLQLGPCDIVDSN